jgi:quinol monooxygenase YgiN
MTAEWSCTTGSETIVLQALKAFVNAIQANEPDTRIYTALQNKAEPNRFLTYFIFESETAQAFHRSTDWVEAFTGAIYPVNLEPVVFTEYELIAST